MVISYKIQPNWQNDTGDTALHICTRKGDLKAVQILCGHDKINKYIENENGETPLAIALDNDTKNHRDITFVLEPDRRRLLSIKSKADVQNTSQLSIKNLADDILGDTLTIDLNAPKNEDYMQTMNTVRCNEAMDDILGDIKQEILIKSQSLKQLNGWMERKQHSPPYSWLKRYVMVKDKYLLWSMYFMCFLFFVHKII